jgi:hypothetical protein
VLNQLRQWIEVNDDDRLFEMPKGLSYDRQRFRNFLRQLKFDEKYFDLQFYDDAKELVGRIVTADSSSYQYGNQNKKFSYFYGSHMYSTGCHRIQIKILDLKIYSGSSPNYYLYLGVIKFSENKKQPQSSYINWPSQTPLPSGNGMFNEFQSGDVIEIEINCNEKFVSATNQHTMIERQITLHNDNSFSSIPLAWRFSVKLGGNGQASIRII